jgi:hypothetical protein
MDKQPKRQISVGLDEALRAWRLQSERCVR